MTFRIHSRESSEIHSQGLVLKNVRVHSQGFFKGSLKTIVVVYLNYF